MARFIDRLLGRTEPSHELVTIEPKRLLLPDVLGPPPPEVKSVGLLPVGAYGQNYTFFSPDGGRTMIDIADPTTIAFIAYWYVATRWRAQKIAEPPLMVAEEDQDTGDMEWIDDHELVSVLEEPSPDYDMGELLEMTSQFLDNTGSALWVMDKDNVGRIARITPFSRSQFEPQRTVDRLYGRFLVQTIDGQVPYDAEECVFFRDSSSTSGMIGGTNWHRGKSRLDVAMNWLKLGAKAQQTIYDLLNNAVWPSAIISPDKDWDPDEKTYEAYKQDIRKYAKSGNKGQPFVALGGATFTKLQADIKNLVPDEVLGRVESIVAAVSGVPAIVLQFQIGLENSPWSQMAQARRMAYDDCIAPAWRKMERTITKQLLRGVDDDTKHFIVFDSTDVASLKEDQYQQVQTATLMGRQASLNERRAVMGLEPVDAADDPEGRADKIPELILPSFAELLAGTVGRGSVTVADPATGQAGAGTNKTPGTKDPTATDTPADAAKKARQRLIERKIKGAALQDAFRDEAIPIYEVAAQHQLTKDAERIVEIVMHTLLDPSEAKTIQTKSRGKDRVMASVDRYLAEDGRKAWTRLMQPLNEKAAQRSGAVVAADMNINFGLLNGNLLTYARKQTGKMITDVNRTTRSLISDIIQGGIDAQKSTSAIARLISEATGFDKSRALLIARTETTKAFNGAPTEAISVLGQTGNRTFTKTWSGVLDDRERDEHVALEGETVGIDETFSNDLQYPSEPNCRCSLLYDETTDG